MIQNLTYNHQKIQNLTFNHQKFLQKKKKNNLIQKFKCNYLKYNNKIRWINQKMIKINRTKIKTTINIISRIKMKISRIMIQNLHSN